MQILYIFALHTRKPIIFKAKVIGSSVRNTKIHENLQTSWEYIFRYLQHFVTKFCSSTNFKTLFSAVMKDFVRFAKI